MIVSKLESYATVPLWRVTTPFHWNLPRLFPIVHADTHTHPSLSQVLPFSKSISPVSFLCLLSVGFLVSFAFPTSFVSRHVLPSFPCPSNSHHSDCLNPVLSYIKHPPALELSIPPPPSLILLVSPPIRLFQPQLSMPQSYHTLRLSVQRAIVTVISPWSGR